MQFCDLLTTIRVLPAAQQADAENDLRALRIWRVLMWAPMGRGKSTLMRGLASTLAAPFRMLSIDADQVDGPNVDRVSLPGFNDTPTFMKFCQAFEAKLKQCEPDLASGKISGIALDTITTIQTELQAMVPLDKAYSMSPVDVLDGKRKQSQTLVSMAAKVSGMHAAGLRSPIDGPIVLAVTEHARLMSKDFVFLGWCPRIGANGGEQIGALFDAMIGVGLEDPNQQDNLRYAVVWNGRADVKVRLAVDEVPVWEECMSMRAKNRADPARVGVAMNRIWGLRKIRWVKRWLAPIDLRRSPDAERLPIDADPQAVVAAALALAGEAVSSDSSADSKRPRPRG